MIRRLDVYDVMAYSSRHARLAPGFNSEDHTMTRRNSIRHRRDRLDMIVGVSLIVASLGILGAMFASAVHYDCYVNPPRTLSIVHALACPAR